MYHPRPTYPNCRFAHIGKVIMKKAKFSQRNTKYIFLTRFSNITSAKDFRLQHSVKNIFTTFTIIFNFLWIFLYKILQNSKFFKENLSKTDSTIDELWVWKTHWWVFTSRYTIRGKGKTVCREPDTQSERIQSNTIGAQSRQQKKKEGLAKVIKYFQYTY